jgi:AraC family transcriptional activator of pobA
VKGTALYQDENLPAGHPPFRYAGRKKEVPFRPLEAYGTVASPVEQVFVARFEEAILVHTDRLHFHRHTYYEAFYMDGKGAVCIDFQDYAITGPTLVFTSPGQVHRWMNSGGLKGPIICFTQEFYDGRELPPSSLLEHEFWFPLHTAPLLALGKEEARSMQVLWHQVELETPASKERNEILRALLRVIFNQATRLYQRQPVGAAALAKEAPSGRLVREFRLAVETHFRKISSVAGYAKLLRLTPDHLASCVGRLTGQAPGEIIRDRMLLEAKRLLIFTSLSVSEIGYELKFEDPAYFSRFFRRLMRISPGEFRRRISEKYQT